METTDTAPDESPRPGAMARFLQSRPALALGIALGYFALFSKLPRSGMEIPYHWVHYLPIDQLMDHPLRSLLYLHAQPPVMDILLWGVHIVAAGLGVAPGGVAACLYAALTFAISVLWFEAAFHFTGSKKAAIAILVLLLVNPSFRIFEQQLSYVHVLMAEAGLLVFAAMRWSSAPAPGRGLRVILAAALMMYTWALWHPAWGCALALWMGLHEARRAGEWARAARRTALRLALLAALVGPWMIKNQILFNSTAFSSWLGINMANLFLGENPIDRYRFVGEYDEATVTAYYSPRQLERLRAEPVTSTRVHMRQNGIDILNLNHYVVPPLSKQSAAMCFEKIRREPHAYFMRCVEHFTDFDLPSYYKIRSRSPSAGTYELVDTSDYARLFNQTYYAAFSRRLFAFKIDWILVTPTLFVLLWLPLAIGRSLWRAWRERAPGGFDAGLLAGLYLWLLAMTIFIDGAESARMRWMLEPAYLIMLAGALIPPARAARRRLVSYLLHP